jgi:hypothetical protein
MKHDPLEKLRIIVTFLLLDLPERELIYKYLKMIGITILAAISILAIGCAIGYYYGGRDAEAALQPKLVNSIVETIKWKRDAENLSEALSDEALQNGELHTHIEMLMADTKAYQSKLKQLNDEVAYTRQELYCTNDAIKEYLANAQVAELHETAQYNLSRKWQARKRATLTTASGYTSSKSNNDA